MTAPISPLINLGPVDDIRQDNAHRAGAANTHMSEGNPMVGNESHVTHLELALAWRCTEVAFLREEIADLRAERDNLMRQVEDLAWDLNYVLAGRPVSTVVGAMFTEHDACELGGGR